MIGFGLQVIGVGVMGSELVETQPQLTYIFGSVFCIVGFTLFYKAHLMFKQGAENIVKIEKIDVAEAYREASRDLEFSNTNTNVNEFQKPKKIRAIEIKKLDFETIANYDELEDIAHAIIYYINEDGHKVDVTMSIYLLEPSEDLSLIGDCSKYTISGQDEINKTNVEITMRSIYRVIDYKTKKPVKRSNTFDFIEEVVARSDLEFRRLKKLNRSSLSIT